MTTVLLAGVSGALGSEVARLLLARGTTVRGLVRDERRVPTGLALSSTHVGDALKPETLKGAADGADVLFSCVGGSVSPELSAGRTGFTRLDTPANLALLEEAKRAGVRRMVYVSVCHSEAMKQLAYVRAHEEVAAAIAASGLAHAIIRPTGFFSAFAGLVPLARKGPLPVFKGGTAKSNPIHEADLAQVCAEAIDGGPSDVAAGGPEVHTRGAVNDLVFAALGKPPRSMRAPLWGLKTAAACTRVFQPRMGELLEFLAGLWENDVVAPVRGTRKLGDYLQAFVARSSSRT